MNVQPGYLARCCLSIVIELHPDNRGLRPYPKSFERLCELREVSTRSHCENIDRLAGEWLTRWAVYPYPEKRLCDFDLGGSVLPNQARERFADYQSRRRAHLAHMQLAIDILADEGVIEQSASTNPGNITQWEIR